MSDVKKGKEDDLTIQDIFAQLDEVVKDCLLYTSDAADD